MNNYLDLSAFSEKITADVVGKRRLLMLGLKPPLVNSLDCSPGSWVGKVVSAVWTQGIQTRHSDFEEFNFEFKGLNEILNMKKKSFLLYVDQLNVLDCMDDTQAGKLFKAVVAYHKGDKAGLEGYLQDQAVRVAFTVMRNVFEANAEKYEAKCKYRQEAGRKGGLQRAENQRKEKEANARKVANPSKSKQNVANQADTVTVTGTVTDTDNVSTTVDDKERYSDEYPKKDGLSLPPSSQSSEKMSFERFNEWLDKKCPYVRKLDMQMTEDEYLWLRRTYTKTQIADGVRALNNWKPLLKKRTNVFQSLSDELERRYGQQK